jgi:hypothetical protein
MTITKGNGGYIIDAMVRSANGRNGRYLATSWLETQQYIYYTRKEAIARFKEYLRDSGLELVK